MNIPQSLGYTKIAGTPVITGLYTLLFPLIAFAAFGSSRYLVVAADSATAAILAGGLAGMAPLGSARYVALAGLVALLTGLFLLIARMLKLGFSGRFSFANGARWISHRSRFSGGYRCSGGNARRSKCTADALRRNFWKLCIRYAQVAHSHVRNFVSVVSQYPHSLDRLAPKFPAPLFAVAGTIAASAIVHWGERGVRLLGPVPGGFPHFGLHGCELERCGSSAARGAFLFCHDRGAERRNLARLCTRHHQ